MSKAITITLPSKTMLRTIGEGANKKPIYLDWSKVPEAVIPAMLEGGMKTVLNNAYNSGGKDRSEAERVAQMEKRINAFYRGEYVAVERGENAYTGMWNAYVDEVRAKATEGGTALTVSDAKRASAAKKLDVSSLNLASFAKAKKD
jgi:hypothetical protein